MNCPVYGCDCRMVMGREKLVCPDHGKQSPVIVTGDGWERIVNLRYTQARLEIYRMARD